MSEEIDDRLEKAVMNDDVDETLYCLTNGANVRRKFTIWRETLLHKASSADIIKVLLHFGAKVNARTVSRQTPLHVAIRDNKDTDVVRELLLNGANVNAKTIERETPLHYNIFYENGLDMLQLLLTHGANVSVLSSIKCNLPLHYAVEYSPFSKEIHLETIKMLLRYGADINAKDKMGCTALHHAVYHEADIDVIRLLLEYEPDLTIKGLDPTGTFDINPLDSAICSRDLTSARVMIKYTLLSNAEEDWKKYIHFEESKNTFLYNEMLTYLNQCLSEIGKIKCHKINGNNILFYWIKKKNGCLKPLYSFKSNFEIEIRDKYPIYHDIIWPRIIPCVKRAQLLKSLTSLQIPDICGQHVFQNSYCLHKIVEYISNDDLFNLVSAFENWVLNFEPEAVSPDQKINPNQMTKLLRHKCKVKKTKA